MPIDLNIFKDIEQTRKKHKVRYYKCSCKICEQCWFSPELEQCLYGGPFSGYEVCTDQTSGRKDR